MLNHRLPVGMLLMCLCPKSHQVARTRHATTARGTVSEHRTTLPGGEAFTILCWGQACQSLTGA